MEFKHTQLNGSNYTDADIKRLIAEYNVQFIKLQFVEYVVRMPFHVYKPFTDCFPTEAIVHEDY